ncbi:M23 family metallopeptidase, partial [bacterium]|nr:M23 family metallopeptidase [bacterium]
MKTRIIILAIVLFLSISATAEEPYLWPTVGNRQISSSFGEYREGHYHAGIDIRSFGRVGIPCFAISDGYVKRVRVQPGGYGRALYLKLDNGLTVVYAHLHGFSAAIDSMVFNKMIESEKNWCDLFLEDEKYRFI